MLAPLTSPRALALLSPSARVLAVSALSDDGLPLAPQLPWSDVHWPTLLSLVPFERAEGQLFRLLRYAPQGAVPDDVVRAIQQLYRVAMFRAAELADAAAAAADALDAKGIAVLWLKGAALSMRHTAGFSLRGMGDLDLLVDSVNLEAARRALSDAGWTAGGSPEEYHSHHHDAPMFWRGGLRLELHSALFTPGHPFAQEPASVWLHRAEHVSWGARTVRLLPVPWHVVYASVHWAWSHEGEIGTWQYLHDMHVLASLWDRAGTGWESVAEHAEAIGAARPVGWALWAASRVTALPVDDATLARLRGGPELGRAMAEREWVVRMFHSPASSPSISWNRFWWRRAMDGLGSANRAWPWALGRAALVQTPADPMAAEAPRALSGRTLSRWRRHLARVLGG